MQIGSVPEVPSPSGHARARNLDPASWVQGRPPLLRDPRALVTELHRIHQPQPGSVVVGAVSPGGRITGSASFSAPSSHGDGWQPRNLLLDQLRRSVPHGLRRSRPTDTTVLLNCRRGPAEWTEEDGAWMWALRDASVLHGLRSGAYVTLTEAGWHVLGDGRWGRSPHSGSWLERTLHTVSELPPRTAEPKQLPSPAAPPPQLTARSLAVT